MGIPCAKHSALCLAAWVLTAWLLCELLLLRQCWKMRLRNNLSSHLFHLFHLGQTELSTGGCHGIQHTGKHQLGRRVLQGWGPGCCQSDTTHAANSTSSNSEVPGVGKMCCHIQAQGLSGSHHLSPYPNL